MTAVIQRGAMFRFRAPGFSMYPFIRDGDILTIGLLSDNAPHAGDVVAFVSPKTKKLLVHRVVKKTGSYYFVKGDNNFDIDGAVARNEIIGRVTRIERDGKRIHSGLGRERLIIAYFSRLRFAFPLALRVLICIKSVSKRLRL